jgi:hypothetical protein
MAWIDGVFSLHLIAGLIMQVLAMLMIVARVDYIDLCVERFYLYLWLCSLTNVMDLYLTKCLDMLFILL